MKRHDGKPTEINSDAPLWSALRGWDTENSRGVHQEPDGQMTEINPNAVPPERTMEYAVGQVLDGFQILSTMNTASGEADLYLCQGEDGSRYCLKHYRRRRAVSQEVYEKLRHLDHPNVAKLQAWGSWEGNVYEVWTYYARGSLAGKRYIEGESKDLIRQMNQALHAIHSIGIVHQDIKPSNFVLTEAGQAALIDFGISGLTGTDGRTSVTRVGKTLDYAAPETLYSGEGSIASDYYSLGITIYELLFGHTPYAHYDDTLLQMKMDDIHETKIPKLEQLSPAYRALLTGLLWYRRDERWGFEQVLDWLAGRGEQQRLRPPGPASGKPGKRFRFQGIDYSIPQQIQELVESMACHWEAGLSLFDLHGRFYRMCKTLEDVEGTEDLYAVCNALKAYPGEDRHLNYFRKLYQLSPALKLFTWRSWQFEDQRELGSAILRTLWNHEDDGITRAVQRPASRLWHGEVDQTEAEAACPSMDELLFWFQHQIITLYLEWTGNSRQLHQLRSLEREAQSEPLARYRLAYQLSGSDALHLPSGTFQNEEEFRRFLEGKRRESDEAGSVEPFLRFCRSELYDGEKVSDGFRAWIEHLGRADSLEALFAKYV